MRARSGSLALVPGLGLVLALAALLGSAPPAAAFEVTSCDTLVPGGEIGELRNDLSCTHTTAHCADQPDLLCSEVTGIGCGRHGPCVNRAVQLGAGATLRMNGHEIRGTDVAVLCRGACTVEGGGGLIADAGVGIRQWSRRRMTVRDVRFSNDGWAINAAYFARSMILSGITVEGGAGIYATRLDATDVAILDLPGCGLGPSLYADRLDGSAISAGSVNVRGHVTVTGLNVIADCDTGLVSARGRVLLTDSFLGGASQADLSSSRQPVLVNTSCDRSSRIDRDGHPTGDDWNVCALD